MFAPPDAFNFFPSNLHARQKLPCLLRVSGGRRYDAVSMPVYPLRQSADFSPLKYHSKYRMLYVVDGLRITNCKAIFCAQSERTDRLPRRVEGV